jgi:hypothetical protein
LKPLRTDDVEDIVCLPPWSVQGSSRGPGPVGELQELKHL